MVAFRERLAELYEVVVDLREATLVKTKVESLTTILTCISDRDVCAHLSKNSFITSVSNDNFFGTNPLTWTQIIRCVMRAAKTLKNCMKLSPQQISIYSSMKRIVEIAEKEGQFLFPVLNGLLQFLIERLRQIVNDTSKAKLFSPISEMIKCIVSAVQYSALITEANFTEIFHLYSAELLSALCDTGSNTRSTVGSAHPAVCAEIVSLVINAYSYDVYPFFEDDVLPFYANFLRSTPRTCTSAAIAIAGLNNIIQQHGMTCAILIFAFIENTLASLVSAVVSIRTPDFRNEIIVLIELLIRLTLRVGVSQCYFGSHIVVAVELRRQLLLDLTQSEYSACKSQIDQSEFCIGSLCFDSASLALVNAAAALLHISLLDNEDELYFPKQVSSCVSTASNEASHTINTGVYRRVVNQHGSYRGVCAWQSFCNEDITLPITSIWLTFVVIARFGNKLRDTVLMRLFSVLQRHLHTFINNSSSVDGREMIVAWLLCTCRFALRLALHRVDIMLQIKREWSSLILSVLSSSLVEHRHSSICCFAARFVADGLVIFHADFQDATLFESLLGLKTGSEGATLKLNSLNSFPLLSTALHLNLSSLSLEWRCNRIQDLLRVWLSKSTPHHDSVFVNARILMQRSISLLSVWKALILDRTPFIDMPKPQNGQELLFVPLRCHSVYLPDVISSSSHKTQYADTIPFPSSTYYEQTHIELDESDHPFDFAARLPFIDLPHVDNPRLIALRLRVLQYGYTALQQHFTEHAASMCLSQILDFTAIGLGVCEGVADPSPYHQLVLQSLQCVADRVTVNIDDVVLLHLLHILRRFNSILQNLRIPNFIPHLVSLYNCAIQQCNKDTSRPHCLVDLVGNSEAAIRPNDRLIIVTTLLFVLANHHHGADKSFKSVQQLAIKMIYAHDFMRGLSLAVALAKSECDDANHGELCLALLNVMRNELSAPNPIAMNLVALSLTILITRNNSNAFTDIIPVIEQRLDSAIVEIPPLCRLLLTKALALYYMNTHTNMMMNDSSSILVKTVNDRDVRVCECIAHDICDTIAHDASRQYYLQILSDVCSSLHTVSFELDPGIVMSCINTCVCVCVHNVMIESHIVFALLRLQHTHQRSNECNAYFKHGLTNFISGRLDWLAHHRSQPLPNATSLIQYNLSILLIRWLANGFILHQFPVNGLTGKQLQVDEIVADPHHVWHRHIVIALATTVSTTDTNTEHFQSMLKPHLTYLIALSCLAGASLDLHEHKSSSCQQSLSSTSSHKHYFVDDNTKLNLCNCLRRQWKSSSSVFTSFLKQNTHTIVTHIYTDALDEMNMLSLEPLDAKHAPLNTVEKLTSKIDCDVSLIFNAAYGRTLHDTLVAARSFIGYHMSLSNQRVKYIVQTSLHLLDFVNIDVLLREASLLRQVLSYLLYLLQLTQNTISVRKTLHTLLESIVQRDATALGLNMQDLICGLTAFDGYSLPFLRQLLRRAPVLNEASETLLLITDAESHDVNTQISLLMQRVGICSNAYILIDIDIRFNVLMRVLRNALNCWLQTPHHILHVDRQLRYIVVKRLLRLCRRRRTRELAAECLGMIALLSGQGVFDEIIQRLDHDDNNDLLSIDIVDEHNDDDDDDDEDKSVVAICDEQRNINIIKALVRRMCHTNATVIRQCVHSLRMLIKLCSSTLDQLPNSIQCLLGSCRVVCDITPPATIVMERIITALQSFTNNTDASFECWICRASSLLLSSSMTRELCAVASVAAVDADFATYALPHALLQHLVSTPSHAQRFAHAFNALCRLCIEATTNVLPMSISLLQRTLNRCLFLIRIARLKLHHHSSNTHASLRSSSSSSSRTRIRSRSSNDIDPLVQFEKAIDYIGFADASCRCGQPADSLLFLNMSADHYHHHHHHHTPSTTARNDTLFSPLLLACNAFTIAANAVGDPDMFAAATRRDDVALCNESHHHHHHVAGDDGDDAVRALAFYDASLSGGNIQAETGLCSSLLSLQAIALLRRFASGSTLYEAAWKNTDFTLDEQWNPRDDDDDDDGAQMSLQRALYRALTTLHNHQRHNDVNDDVVVAHNDSMMSLVAHEVQCGRNTLVNEFNINARCNQFLRALVALAQVNVHTLCPARTTQYDCSFDNDLSWSLQGVLLSITKASASTLEQHRLSVVARARQAGLLARSRLELRRITKPSEDIRDKISLEHARLLYLEGHRIAAIQVLLSNDNDDGTRWCEDGYALMLLGEYAAEMRTHAPDEVIEYVERALALSTTTTKSPSELTKHADWRAEALCKISEFEERYVQSIFDKQRMPEYKASVALHRKKQKDIDTLSALISTKQNSMSDDERMRAMGWLKHAEKESRAEQYEYERHNKRLCSFIEVSVNHAAQCLVESPRYALRCLYRLVSMWFQHFERVPIVCSIVTTLVEQVPSSVFLPLIYQIASRLQTRSKKSASSLAASKFQDSVHTVIEKTCGDHPHHAVFTILSLRNLDRINNHRSHRLHEAYDVNTDKQFAADTILKRLCRLKCVNGERRNTLAILITTQTQLVEAYIQLVHNQWSTKINKLNLSREKLQLSSLPSSKLQLLVVPTSDAPVRRDCAYDADYIKQFGLQSFSNQAVFAASGINRPLILSYKCQNGMSYKQLVKPNDDLRQDAVMEQLFMLVNELLKDDRDSLRRGLAMRTYHVVPLTPCVGVVQFVSNTKSLHDYLVRAHAHYRPQDISMSEARKIMANAVVGDRHKLYQRVTSRFLPVLHHFLLERWPYASDWLHKQIAYTRSVAVASMVGYTVGLGDRHLSNILIDIASATLVHIDLGIAFDQGKVLKIPEQTPFRLTRDLVDAMGIAGVEGVFRRSCEHCMRVLRHNQQMLLTVLEVFKFDPLYRWSISPLKLGTIQADKHKSSEDNDSDVTMPTFPQSSSLTRARSSPPDSPTRTDDITMQGNTNAMRAWLGIKKKLQGREDGDVLSVDGQVRKLIAQARNSKNLANMFYGWSAWC